MTVETIEFLSRNRKHVGGGGARAHPLGPQRAACQRVCLCVWRPCSGILLESLIGESRLAGAAVRRRELFAHA